MDVRDAPKAVQDAIQTALNHTQDTMEQPPTTQQGREALKDIAFGSIAGIGGKYVEYPFDTVKVRLQSQPDHLPLRYTGPLDCFRQSLRQDGFVGMYRGISAPLVGAALETSSLFFSYRISQSLLQATILPPSTGPLPLSALITCGAMSGAFTSLLLTPIELIKCKMQVPLLPSESGARSSVASRPGALTLIASIYRQHGLSGFWHGQMGTLIREMGGSAAWFGSYEGVCGAYKSARLDPNLSQTVREQDVDARSASNEDTTRLPLSVQLLAGAAAGMSYNFIFYPADTIKSRMQTEDSSGLRSGGSSSSNSASTALRKSFLEVGRAIWTQHGLTGFYRGCGITVARAAPSSALIFSVYEGLRSRFG